MTATDALSIARSVASGATSARAVTESALAAIAAGNGRINAFSAVLAERALAQADAIDFARARGERLGPLAGVPFAAKNLFDIEGLATLAGSRINADRPPAARDAAAVERLTRAGAVLVGATHMDEYAFGFTTRNTHYGPTRNPHDPRCIAGGSSGGSAAAVAAGLVPLALGTDTGGSVRVPAALCGTFGLKPTYGRVSRRGVFPFSASMDHVGVFARSVADLALAYDVLQGPDPQDAGSNPRPADPVGEVAADLAGLTFARADGYFETHLGPEARAGVDRVADALCASEPVSFPFTETARAAAFLLSPAEGAQLHQANLAGRAADFDPAIRDRLLAGLFTPAAWLMQVQRVRRRYRDAVVAVLEKHDVVIAGATPWPAFPVETESLSIDGRTLPAGPNTGMLTQPFSFIGVPVLVVPVVRPGALPVGVQLIAAPWREAVLFRVARALEATGTVAAPVAAA